MYTPLYKPQRAQHLYHYLFLRVTGLEENRLRRSVSGVIICGYLRRKRAATMTQLKVGDRVCIRGLVQSDCLGLTGTVLAIDRSALFGPGIQRCRVDFNGKIRHLLSIHLCTSTKADRTASVAA